MKNIVIKVRLKSYLASIGVTSYALGKWVEGVSWQTIYAVAGETRRPSLEVLEAILNALRANGFDTALSDIIEVEETED